MALRDALLRVIHDYPLARSQEFGGHPTAEFIRTGLAAALRAHVNDDTRYMCEGSPGKGNWSGTPWVAAFDVLVTDSAQRGYYPVFLFREDLSGVYLSINQGVTDLRRRYKAGAKDTLRARAVDFRAQLGRIERLGFPLTQIDLRTKSPSSLGADYEAGNICAVFWEANQIPSDEILHTAVARALDAYRVLSENESIPMNLSAAEDDEAAVEFVEDLTKLRAHKRVERNRKLADAVKATHGCRCAACDMSFEEEYGELGKGFIEAHHLTPVSLLAGQKLARDPRRDFAVLCSNCHRMIHKSEAIHDVEAFRRTHLRRKNS